MSDNLVPASVTHRDRWWTLAPAQPEDIAALVCLLQQHGLPANDIERHIAQFIVARANGHVIGAAGLECYPPSALLRSVVVESAWRGKGIAAAMTQAMVEQARERGITRLCLLTETAADYFARVGFDRCQRDALPRELADAPQVKTLCCASAQAMARAL